MCSVPLCTVTLHGTCCRLRFVTFLAVQVMVVPISEASLEYAQQVRSQLRKAKMHVDVDATDRKMQKKVREAQLAQYNYILVSASAVADSELFEHVLAGCRTHHKTCCLCLMGLHCTLFICTVGSLHSGTLSSLCTLASFFHDLHLSLLGAILMLGWVMGGCCMLPCIVLHKVYRLLPRLAPQLPDVPHRWWVSRR